MATQHPSKAQIAADKAEAKADRAEAKAEAERVEADAAEAEAKVEPRAKPEAAPAPQIPVAVPEYDACRAYAQLAQNFDNPLPADQLLTACANGLAFARGKTSAAPPQPTPWTALSAASSPPQAGGLLNWGNINWQQIIVVILDILQSIAASPTPAHAARASSMIKEMK